MRRGAILLVALSLLVVACRASAAEPTVPGDQPSATPAPTSTTTAPPAATTTVVPEDDAFPVSVPSDLGPVDIEDRPARIVSLSATATEMLYAVGAGEQVVATDLTSNYPDAATRTAKLDSFNFSVEEVAALDPDLVILAFDFQGETVALATLDIPFLLLGPPVDLAAAFSQLGAVGAATGHAPEAETLATALAAEIAEVVLSAEAIQGVTVYHEVDETLYSATSSSFIGDLYRRLGLVNIADRADVAGPFPQLSAEFIVDQNPEFIFLADANFGVTVESVVERPGWETITAVADGNVIPLDGDVAGRWGPRTVDLMRSILEAIEQPVP
ncbi:MAG: ABC transporter substrate-binding protein [Acidimicrobiia bacterium]|nr:ABC transporter substrate-binding protein [Acidimicrobiia bacterium]